MIIKLPINGIYKLTSFSNQVFFILSDLQDNYFLYGRLSPEALPKIEKISITDFRIYVNGYDAKEIHIEGFFDEIKSLTDFWYAVQIKKLIIKTCHQQTEVQKD